MQLPNEYNIKASERKWQKFWEKNKIYSFSPKSKSEVYSIDTPPPTVSGKMHIGHASSYSQQDMIVRFHRMQGKNILYPFGTDDNGLPTERLIEKLKNVKSTKMNRQDFINLCNKTLKEIKPDFVNDWKLIGMSCDFSQSYSTIDKHSIRTSQKSFLDLYKKNLVYQKEAATMFCVNCQTAIAQAELEDKELDSYFSEINFELEDGKKLIIATTRPELLAACVCIFVNPLDQRYKHLIGKKAKVPLFNQTVKIIADKSADINKGTGALMVCSFGDKYDVEAVNKLKLIPRIIFTKDGKLNELAGKYADLTIKEARKQILDDLEKNNLSVTKKQIKHNVNVHDKCGTEIEFLTTKQWFIKILDNKKKFIEAGKKINWHSKTMLTRYINWVKGIEWDWCISRQRHFGVPFPLWYCDKCNNIILAKENDLPIDPLNEKVKCKCSGSGLAEKDVMDTWATSSLTPQIVLNWSEKNNLMRYYPMSLRPQAHDIIRTWAFYTIVKSLYHHNQVPWKDIIISGHVLDSKGESMHKSKGNVIEPASVLHKYGADSLRYWAASSKLGEDIRYLEKDLVTAHKLLVKLWNASKFSIMHLKGQPKKPRKLEIIDSWLLSRLTILVEEVTKDFSNYEISEAKRHLDNFFWQIFTSNYLELVKDRIYNPKNYSENAIKSAQFTLYYSLLTLIKLFSPVIPYITEEIYQSYFEKFEKYKSIHISSWPVSNKKLIDKNALELGNHLINIIANVRQFKSKNNLSMKAPIKLILDIKKFKPILEDIKFVTNAIEIKDGSFNVES